MEFQTISPSGFYEMSLKDPTEGNFNNKILRGEISAVEAYHHVINKFFDKESHSTLIDLTKIRNEHEYACVKIRQLVKSEGAIPSEESGPWGRLVSTVIRTASLTGEDGAIRLLKLGEEHGLSLYEAALQLKISHEERILIRQVLIPKQNSHITSLRKLLEFDLKFIH
jgi:hypothetical protein